MAGMEVKDFVRKYEAEHNQYIPTIGEKIMSVNEYAEMVGVTPGTIRYRVKKGRIKGHKEGDRWVVVVQTTEQYNLMVENERLKAENEKFRSLLSCIANIVNVDLLVN